MRCSSLPTRGCAEAGGMEEATLFKRKVSDRSTVTPSGERWYRMVLSRMCCVSRAEGIHSQKVDSEINQYWVAI
mgnify:CR=1 FL=1